MRKRLVFISTRFLFPVDSGGKIRTTQILRGMKGGSYEITLMSPALPEEQHRYADEIAAVCDHFEPWPARKPGRAFHYTRLRHILDPVPIPVATDRNRAATRLIQEVLAERADVAVFDFLHAAVLAPESVEVPSVLFTHNVEAEIFARHLDTAPNPFMRSLWRNQYRKMETFEAVAVRRFDVIVAVSERDAAVFQQIGGGTKPYVIPTGVDLDFFQYQPTSRDREVVFCGSMDWLANQDAVGYFLEDVWPLIVKEEPDAFFKVVGRAPPRRLIERASRAGHRCHFTGYVDDVRPHVGGAAVSVIPLRVGGGTRLKAYEALAMGTPLVSTSVGVEGLPLVPEKHYLLADSAGAFAEAVVKLLRSAPLRQHLAGNARRFVEERFSYLAAAQAFERACDLALSKGREGRLDSAGGVIQPG